MGQSCIEGFTYILSFKCHVGSVGQVLFNSHITEEKTEAKRNLFALGHRARRNQSQDSHSKLFDSRIQTFITSSCSFRGTMNLGEFPLVGQELGCHTPSPEVLSLRGGET